MNSWAGPYPTYKKAEDRIAEAIAGLPAELSPPARQAAIDIRPAAEIVADLVRDAESALRR